MGPAVGCTGSGWSVCRWGRGVVDVQADDEPPSPLPLRRGTAVAGDRRTSRHLDAAVLRGAGRLNRYGSRRKVTAGVKRRWPAVVDQDDRPVCSETAEVEGPMLRGIPSALRSPQRFGRALSSRCSSGPPRDHQPPHGTLSVRLGTPATEHVAHAPGRRLPTPDSLVVAPKGRGIRPARSGRARVLGRIVPQETRPGAWATAQTVPDPLCSECGACWIWPAFAKIEALEAGNTTAKVASKGLLLQL